MKCSGKVYGMRVSMTQQSENFQGVIFTTITHSINQNIYSLVTWFQRGTLGVKYPARERKGFA